ncbi:MAG: ATP-binding protein [Candidatus Anammoxibacter sp.]
MGKTNQEVITAKPHILRLLLEQCLLQEEVEVRIGEGKHVFHSRIFDSFPEWEHIVNEKDRNKVKLYDPFLFLKEGKCLLIGPPVSGSDDVQVNDNDNLFIRFFTGHNSFEAQVHVEHHVDIDGKLEALQVSFPKQLTVIHTRNYIRYKSSPESKITLNITTENQCKLSVRIVELSASGLSFCIPREFNTKLIMGGLLTLNIDFFGEDEMVVEAKISHFSKADKVAGSDSDPGDVLCGVDFLLSDNSTEYLRIDELIFLIQREYAMNEKERLIKFNQNLEKEVSAKACELREKDVQLMEMDRMAGISTLAAGIAHEINNPISFVKGNINFLRKSLKKLVATAEFWHDKSYEGSVIEEYREHLTQINFEYLKESLDKKCDTMLSGIERITNIVKNLKSFSRVDKGRVDRIDLNESIKEAVNVLATNNSGNVEFVMELEEVPSMECVVNDINQCLLQVLKNAVDALEGDGIIKVSSHYDKEEDRIVVTVIDNGKGMSPEVLRQVCNPFFTTKPVGSGTGLGLSTVERIIKNHGGKMAFTSKEGFGTTVMVMFAVNSSTKCEI